MNPGPVEEVGATARQAIGGLATNPVILGLVLMQLVLLIAVAYVGTKRLESQSRDFRLLIDRCLPGRGTSPTATPDP